MNNRIFLLFVWVFALSASYVNAQQTVDLETKTYKIGTGDKELSIDDAIIGQYRQFYPDYILNIRWKDKKHYTFIEQYSKIMVSTPTQKKAKELISLQEINKMYKNKGLTPLLYITGIEWINSNQFYINLSNVLAVIDIKKKEIVKSIQYSEEAENVEYQKDAGYLTYTKGQNLYINDGKKEIAVTEDTIEGIVNGQTVHRSEFGISGGIFWSPKGNLLAYYHKDETMVSDYPLVDITERVAKLKNIKYPMAGMKSEEVNVCVYNPKTQQTITLKTGEPKEQYLTNISWSPDEKRIFIQVLNREQNHMKMNVYDATNGTFIKTLFEEKHDKYVEPQHPIVFLKNNPNEFLYFSQKDGFMHLYKYNVDGKLIKQLTKGNWIVKDFVGFDKSGKKAIIETTKESPLNKQAYSLDLNTGDLKNLTPASGTHTISLNPYADIFVDGYSSMEVPKCYQVNNLQGKTIRKIQCSEEKLQPYKLGEMTIGTIKSADQKTDLIYRLITPPNFDKNKKYPALIYVYGGPHAQLITNSWLASSQLWLFYMAQRGYVVFTVDNRGSGNRGRDFENVIHRHLGDAEMADQLKGVEFLKSLPYVDADRIGVDGWSFGGFMTTNLLLTYPDVFKVGAAGGPVIDWKYYEVMYGERYMDTPQENPEGYEKANLTKRVKDLKGRLLVIHGSQDPTVVWQHTQAFVRECIKNGVLLDYFIYPTHEHNVSGKDRVHLFKKITQHFDDFLK